MNFYYDLYPIKDNINTSPKTGFKAKAISIGTQGVEYIAEQMASRQTFSKGEIMGLIYALSDQVELLLASGFNVDLGDLGTFSVSATSRTVQDKDEIRSESVKMKRIVHRPSRNMTKRLKSLEFTRIPQDLAGKRKRKIR